MFSNTASVVNRFAESSSVNLATTQEHSPRLSKPTMSMCGLGNEPNITIGLMALPKILAQFVVITP